VNFKSADDQGKALKLSETKVLGYEIELRKPKGKEVKKDMQTRLECQNTFDQEPVSQSHPA